MKKLLLVASFGVAGLVSAKGSVENKLEEQNKATTEQKEVKKEEQSKQLCGVVITYWEGGQVVGTQTITSDQPTLESCQKFQQGIKFLLAISGYWLT